MPAGVAPVKRPSLSSRADVIIESGEATSSQATSERVDDIDGIIPVAGLPPDKTMLSSETMEALQGLCVAAGIDYTHFKSREEYVAALQRLYPKPPLNRQNSDAVKEVLKGGKVTKDASVKLDDLFRYLLQTLQVQADLQNNMLSAYSLQEKGLILGDCKR